MKDYSAEYSRYYNLLTGHKSYQDELKFLLNLLEYSGFGNDSRVLSVGCGTGSHERLLAKHVHSVIGIDQSPYMIDCGIKMDNPPNLTLTTNDLSFFANSQFDIVVSLFNVANCISPESLLSTFIQPIADKLKIGGLLVLEVWNRNAVITVPPTTVVRKYSSKRVVLSRTATPYLDPANSTLRLEYTINGFDQGQPVSIDSTHFLYLHPIELIENYLSACGFGPIKWYSALSEGMNQLTDHSRERMLLLTTNKCISL